MRIPRYTKRFRRDYAKVKRSGKKVSKLEAIMALLIDGQPLPLACKDHALQGEWRHVRDCHIEGDWILLYELAIEEGRATITFHATDNHEHLFVYGRSST